MSLSLPLKGSLLGVALMVVAGAATAMAFERHLTGAWFAFGVHPEMLTALEQHLEDQRTLAELDPAQRSSYRERFEQVEALTQNFRILEYNRDDLVKRYRFILLLAFGGTVLLTSGVSWLGARRQARRLERLQAALTDLASGRTDISLGTPRRDLIGRIGTMIERTSRVMARDRQRLKALENLSAWQEAARRHAHEMRTPLTGARLELTRLQGLLSSEDCDPEQRPAMEQATQSAVQELERLGRFTQAFTSFARLPRPELRPTDLVELLREYVTTFQDAWTNIDLALDACEAPRALVDRDMLRQVLVNLCDNSALALGDTRGRVVFEMSHVDTWVVLDVIDDGPGIRESIRPRLFEPYTTTRGIGEGMGLGLAISKKILLDHGGDLQLHGTSPQGTTFRLTLLAEPSEPTERG